MIFNIQRFSTHDGNGIRTVIFYKGCPLNCWWCSNPESQSFGYSILYNKKFCKTFGDCVQAESEAISTGNGNGIHINRDRIKNPEQLKTTCLSRALTISGENKTPKELLSEVEKDILFYRENGGVTLSGGEPLSQGNDLTELLEQLKHKNINVNIETTLYVKWEKVDRCFGLVDTFLADLKHTDEKKFRKYTNGESNLVLDNLKKLDLSGEKYIIRIPVIPEFNHTEKEMKNMIDFARSLRNAKEIHFLPYHTFGIEKYKMLDLDYRLKNVKRVDENELEPYIRYAQSNGFRTKIGG